MSAALVLGLSLAVLPADAPLAAPAPTLTAPLSSVEGSSAALMVAQMDAYLDAERTESKLFVGMGVLSIAGGAAALAASERDFMKGASYPLMGVGLIQLVVGSAVWWRTEEQKAQLRMLIHSEPSRYVSEESARMKQVNDNFVIYRWTEISLLGAGLATAGAGHALDKEFVTGLGVGLAFQSAVMLTLDYFAEQRGNEYADQVGGFRF